MRRTSFSGLVILACSGLLAPPMRAQLPPSSSTTSTPVPGAGHDYLGGVSETVNPASGSVSIRIPVIIPPGRGITLPFSFAYDSNGVNYLSPTAGAAFYWKMSNSITSTGGWSVSVPTLSASLLQWQTTNPFGFPKNVSCEGHVNYVFQDPRGNRHNLDMTNYNDPYWNQYQYASACTYNTSDWPSGFVGAVVPTGGEGPILSNIPSNTTYNTEIGGTVTDGDGTTFTYGSTQCCTAVPNSVVD